MSELPTPRLMPPVGKTYPVGYLILRAEINSPGPIDGSAVPEQVFVLYVFDGKAFVPFLSQEGVDACNSLLG